LKIIEDRLFDDILFRQNARSQIARRTARRQNARMPENLPVEGGSLKSLAQVWARYLQELHSSAIPF
jgi:hypothetical protein